MTRELEVDVKFDTLPNPLIIGEETEVDIETGRQIALVVPLSAVIERNDSKGILVVVNGLATFRPVSLGLQDAQRAEVLDGLQGGEMVVINPGTVQPGKRIRPDVRSAGGRRNS